MKRHLIFSLLGIIVIATLAYSWYANKWEKEHLFSKKSFKHQFVIEQAHSLLGFDLVDPQQAPPDIRDSVMRGYRLVMNTHYYAPEFSKNQLSCTNCHLCGGDTIGGKNGGISLVGVTTIYPQFSKRDGKSIDLSQRIHNCFERSMNGIAPAPDSAIMKDILAYLDWISKEVEHIENIPWLGLPTFKLKHVPNSVEGEKLYQTYCVSCHKADGEGGGILGLVDGKTIPPLWGPNSFNDGAGMDTMNMLAPFIFLNMPYQQAVLTKEEALDIAAYIRLQPRPKFKH
jgi:thiosulfate dehydrogenase